jgi:hypothetical protein
MLVMANPGQTLADYLPRVYSVRSHSTSSLAKISADRRSIPGQRPILCHQPSLVSLADDEEDLFRHGIGGIIAPRHNNKKLISGVKGSQLEGVSP